MGTLVEPERNVFDMSETVPRSIVARVDSELAQALRAGGWQARAGWRALDCDPDRPVWFVRFEQPDETSSDD